MDDPFSYNPVPLQEFKHVKVRYAMPNDKQADAARIAELESAIRDFLCEHLPCNVCERWCSAHQSPAKYANYTLCSFGRDLADLRAALERKESAK